jgi:hypothetical protein
MTRAEISSIIASAVTAWRDGFSALNRMRAISIIAFAIVLTFGLINRFFAAPAEPSVILLLGVVVAFAIVYTFVVTPLAIAVHRYVLLNEVTQRYSINPSDPRFWRFFLFALILFLLLLTPFLFAILSAWAMLTAMPLIFFSMSVVYFIAASMLVAIIIIMVRTVILFPAIAVDAPGAGWMNAWRDSKGHFWRILLVMALVVVPAYVISLSLPLLFPSPHWFFEAIGWLIDEAITVVTLAAMAAAASRLYVACGSRLGPPPGGLASARTESV